MKPTFRSAWPGSADDPPGGPASESRGQPGLSPFRADESGQPYPPALLEAALDRILASTTFRRSLRHRQFLTHVVRATIDRREDQLKEIILGIEVFGRDLTRYDPRIDPIVRVEAGRIRDKLARYYAGEGAEEPFWIDIPTGSYAPRLTRRTVVPKTMRILESVAVLPFANLSGQVEDESFCIGIVDQLIDTLGRVPGLKVVARISAFKAHEKGIELRAIGKLLGVQTVVAGSIQRHGRRVRCHAHVSRTRDGVQVWSRRFEHDESEDQDLFGFQDLIAEALMAAVIPEATRDPQGPGIPSPVFRPGLSSAVEARARDLFERARYLTRQGTIEGYRKAIALLEQAVAIAPSFAQAHSHLGAALASLAPFVFAPPIPSFARVKQAAMRALELDPLDGDARALIAIVAHRIESDWSRAEPMFREALRVAPNSTLAHTAFSWGLVFNGRFEEAMRHARIALELDPLNLALRGHNARLYAYARQYELALSEAQAVLDIDPDHLYSRLVLGVIHLSQGDHEAALPHFKRVARTAPDHSGAHFHIICVHGLRGEVERGRRELAALLERLEGTDHSQFLVALAYCCLGDREGTYASLERAAEARDSLFVATPAHVLFDRWHDDPAFVALLRRHGLNLLPQSRSAVR